MEINDNEQQTTRRFLPTIISRRKLDDLSCGMLKQWVMLGVVFTFLVLVVWAMLGSNSSIQSGRSSRSGSSAGRGKTNAKSYQPISSGAAIFSSPMGRSIFMEGHWMGMEVGPLTSRLATSLAIPASVSGVLVDEVTLLSAGQGLLAGDVVVSIAGQDTANLDQFLEASKKVKTSKKVVISVFRRGKYLSIPLRSDSDIGFAQMEAAPMIRPTDTAPHRYYGPCTNCHTIGSTGQLSADLGDTIKRPLPSVRGGAPSPHRNYGKCAKCHKVLDPIFKGHNQIGAQGGL